MGYFFLKGGIFVHVMVWREGLYIWDRFMGGMSTTNYDIPCKLSGLE